MVSYSWDYNVVYTTWPCVGEELVLIKGDGKLLSLRTSEEIQEPCYGRRACPIYQWILQLQTVSICCLELGMNPSIMLSGMVSQAVCLYIKKRTLIISCRLYNRRLGNFKKYHHLFNGITNRNFWKFTVCMQDSFTDNVLYLCTRNKVAEKYMYSHSMHCQKSKESLDACAQEGGSRVLHVVLTMTFSDILVFNHLILLISVLAIKNSLNVVVFPETNHYVLTNSFNVQSLAEKTRRFPGNLIIYVGISVTVCHNWAAIICHFID